MLLTMAYGLGVLFGLALVMRPFMVLGALIFRPALLGAIGLAGAGAVMVVPGTVANPSPELATGLGAVVLGAAMGLVLRSLFRGGI